MKVKIAKWGNSLGVRLPKAAVEAVGASVGSDLDLTIEPGGFRLRKKRKTSGELLAEMLAEIDRLGPDCAPETVDWGPDRGVEVIDDAYSRGEITLEDILSGKAKRKPPVKRGSQRVDGRARRR
jgi:antitoxin MazE